MRYTSNGRGFSSMCVSTYYLLRKVRLADGYNNSFIGLVDIQVYKEESEYTDARLKPWRDGMED